MTRIEILAFASVLAAVAGCATNPTTPPTSTSPTATTTASPTATLRTGFRGLPVDPTLTPISLTKPPADAVLALEQCVFGLEDSVAGMAQLPARELRRFVLTNGNEPELQTDALVWAVQYEGVIFGRRGNAIDALCVVVADMRYLYAPYGVEGETFSPPPDFTGPTAALPPLEP